MIRFFQAMGFGEYYLNNYRCRFPYSHATFDAQAREFLDDRYCALHILKPIYDHSTEAFFTVCDASGMQIKWAREHGFRSSNLNEILLAQIEEHNTEVFYTNNPIGLPSSFVKKMPGSVKQAIAWRAAPSGNADLSAYDAIVSNFDFLNEGWRERGWQARNFYPSWDPEMLPYSENKDRSTSIFFTGSYARTTGHNTRLELLNAIGGLDDVHKVDLRLLYRKWGRLRDDPPWRWIPFPIRLPKNLKPILGLPVFGREMYDALSKSKIVINPATDIAGKERGNMRCWEALGCGACMVGSVGQYPEGFVPGLNFESFSDTHDMTRKVNELLLDEPRRLEMAREGSRMLAKIWSKKRQWSDFKLIVGKL